MKEFLWIIFEWICKGIVILMLLSAVLFFFHFFWTMITYSSRKNHYYGLNTDTCRFEAKQVKSASKPKKKRPEWVRFLFEETPASLWEKRKRRKWAEKR